MKFQVGDIVVGNEKADKAYILTKTGCVLEVVTTNERWFRGRVISNAPGKMAKIGKVFLLGYENFDLKESMIQENE